MPLTIHHGLDQFRHFRYGNGDAEVVSFLADLRVFEDETTISIIGERQHIQKLWKLETDMKHETHTQTLAHFSD
jgi:hypothetical protein